MKRNSKELMEWVPSESMQTIARLCETFNKDRVYEVFWEYCRLTEEILRERGAFAWLYHENNVLSGFAVGRKRRVVAHLGEAFVFEEVWGPCEGSSTELGVLDRKDRERAFRFKESVYSSNSRFPMILRAATDNQFAHTIARVLKAKWVNGLVIAEKRLEGKFELSFPAEYRFRMLEDGDQFSMSKIHREAFDEDLSPEEYRSWASKENCRTIIATNHGEPIGFIIAEKRRCDSLGDFNIAIKPAHQGKGVGSVLLKAAFNTFLDMKVKKVIADYLLLNKRAHLLYFKHGFMPKRIYNYFVV
jgi:ribosomal protein S18 acetylase RimI-like enzyme